MSYFLTYASTAVNNYSDEELLTLLTKARFENQKREITGLLLYAQGTEGFKGTFVQVLEGPRSAVRSLYEDIRLDRRHTDCTLVQEGSLFQRRFRSWTMGFRNLSQLSPADVPGFDPIFLRGWSLAQVLAEPDPVLRLLYSFAAD